MSITSSAVTGFLKAAQEASKGKPEKDDKNNLILRLPTMYGTMGVVSLLLSLFLFYVYYFEINQEIFIPLVLAIFFLLGGIYLLLETWVQKVIINESNILQKKLWGDIVTISWNEIKDITYNGLSAQLSIVGSAGTLKIHKDSVGFPTLLDIIEMRYGKSAKDLGCPEYLIKKGN